MIDRLLSRPDRHPLRRIAASGRARRATIASIGILAAAVGLAACSTGSSQSQASASREDAVQLTPVLVKEKMNNLGAFGACEDAAPGNAKFTAVVCSLPGTDDLDFEAVGGGRSKEFAEAETGFVAVYLSGDGDLNAACLGLTGGLPPSSPVVTDSSNFIAYGQAFTVDTLTRPKAVPGTFPPGVWPEDVQRALGGAVKSAGEACGY